MRTCRVPAATSRIQFTLGFGFADALALIPGLGVAKVNFLAR
jgi:maltooligosyltrehalose synthase